MRRHLLCLSGLLAGCVATDVGNPQTDPATEATVRIEAYEEDVPPTALTLADGVVLTHVWMATDRMRLTACEEDGETEDSGEDAEFVAATDLLSGSSLPSAPVLGGIGRSFCGFELRVRVLEDAEVPAGAPAELAGQSMLVRGIRKDGNPFILRAQLEETIELQGPIALSADSPNTLVLGFAVNGWVSQRVLGALDGDPILIDASNNTAVYEAFEETVLTSARLFDGAIAGEPIAR